MKILLTNDDGADAPGLSALYESVRHVFGSSVEITVIAPDCGRSECGHSVTTGRPLQLTQVSERWYSIDGTPVDCVRAALAELAADADFVFSGVNAGANLGVDLLVSGTFAAAREAALHGVDSMAVSHYRHPDVPATWDHVPTWLDETIREFVNHASRRDGHRDHGLLWNVNLPAIDPAHAGPPRVRCPVDRLPMTRTAKAERGKIHWHSDFHSRPRAPGSDVEQCFGGKLTISELVPHIA